MNKEEFNKLSNFDKLVELCAIPSNVPRYVYLIFPNGKKHRLYVDSCEYVAHHEHYDENWNIVNEPVVLIKDTTFPIPCYKGNKELVIVAEHD